jgi:3-deoxy-manno-octulosonate cytidylyltransferase (CMP-KDO synthetase)
VRIVGIIPARMAATRFPGKPLALLGGYPMIEHVYRRAKRCSLLSEVYLATPDHDICEAVDRFGGNTIMTADSHERCTDRVAEAARSIDADIVVNIQGDEPLIHPDAITELCRAALDRPDALCLNLANFIDNEIDFLNPNQIKVVCDCTGNALYMSRQPVPARRGGIRVRGLRQLGMIAFRRDFLETFATLPATPLEQAESIDMLRAIEHGYPVAIIVSEHESFGIDTPEDLQVAESRLAADPLAAELFPGISIRPHKTER